MRFYLEVSKNGKNLFVEEFRTNAEATERYLELAEEHPDYSILVRDQFEEVYSQR